MKIPLFCQFTPKIPLYLGYSLSTMWGTKSSAPFFWKTLVKNTWKWFLFHVNISKWVGELGKPQEGGTFEKSHKGRGPPGGSQERNNILSPLKKSPPQTLIFLQKSGKAVGGGGTFQKSPKVGGGTRKSAPPPLAPRCPPLKYTPGYGAIIVFWGYKIGETLS